MSSILLVDDDSSVLLTLSIALKRCGYDVTVAGTGQQALDYIESRKFDVMISDIRMPGMSGLELAALVQNHENPPRIILTSAHYDSSLTPNSAQIAEAFMQKPIEIDMLCQQLNKKPRRHVSSFRRKKQRILRRAKRVGQRSLA